VEVMADHESGGPFMTKKVWTTILTAY